MKLYKLSWYYYLRYSTCALNRQENSGVVESLLKKAAKQKFDLSVEDLRVFQGSKEQEVDSEDHHKKDSKDHHKKDSKGGTSEKKCTNYCYAEKYGRLILPDEKVFGGRYGPLYICRIRKNGGPLGAPP
jgi:16S rRNA C967 or C1407 C5-methylase (RsmB/RsmF family)